MVSKRIDNWHRKISLKKQGTFNNDQDFIEIEHSPSRFESLSSSSRNSNSSKAEFCSEFSKDNSPLNNI